MKNKKRIRVILCVAALSFIVPVTTQYTNTAAEAATVKINKTKATINKGKTVQLSISGTKSNVSWKSTKKDIATVNYKGLVTAKKKGTTTIVATVNKKKYTCKVVVKENSSATVALKINSFFITEDISDLIKTLKVKSVKDPDDKYGTERIITMTKTQQKQITDSIKKSLNKKLEEFAEFRSIDEITVTADQAFQYFDVGVKGEDYIITDEINLHELNRECESLSTAYQLFSGLTYSKLQYEIRVYNIDTEEVIDEYFYNDY